MQYDVLLMRGNWQSWSYLHELIQTAGFVASMQVSDTLDPEFGGIIEGEDAINVVETDNTQQAIWVWCRYFELTGDTIYFENIRRAWIYVMNHPAYQEEGTDSDYYRVWNCGLALFAESKYRETMNDSLYLPYADTCIVYMMAHPLPFDSVSWEYRRLHPKVTSLVAGMLYQYGKNVNSQVYMDTALVYGMRVQNWIEADPETNINDEVWAMSGGTAVWGICRSVFDADTSTGVAWLNIYLPYMKFFQPTGNWNNSWNIWYANAYNFAARITQSGTYVEYHHALTDSLLVQDYDDDGGVPPTRGWNENQDHSWVSNYMFFMGFEGLLDSLKDYDAGVNAVIASGPRQFYLVGDTLAMALRAANYGYLPLPGVPLHCRGGFNVDTIADLPFGVEKTIWFTQKWVLPDTGYFDLTAFSTYPGDERIDNDTFTTQLYVRPLRLVTGTIQDSSTGTGIAARLFFQFIDDSGAVYFDSTGTDSTTGTFSIYLIDSLYRMRAVTDIPYPDFIEEDIYVTPDSVSPLLYDLNTCDIPVINRDNLARYAGYYEIALDSLNITYKIWSPVSQGLFPITRVSEFNENVIIWYTGDAETNNITAEEQESLTVFLDAGGFLLLTGQNIGEELAGTPFYNDYLHAQLISDSLYALRCYPQADDSLGQYCGRLFTAGLSGAGNQYSRDVIASDGLAHTFLYYDSLLTDGAALWYSDPVSGFRIIYCAFGLEAVHKPLPWTGYMTRKQIIQQFLRWFGVGLQEHHGAMVSGPLFSIYPNPARILMRIFLENAPGEQATVTIYDVTGRSVKRIDATPEKGTITWDLVDDRGRRVSEGVYFVHCQTPDSDYTVKAVLLE